MKSARQRYDILAEIEKNWLLKIFDANYLQFLIRVPFFWEASKANVSSSILIVYKFSSNIKCPIFIKASILNPSSKITSAIPKIPKS
jgi:hypothetical protein